MRTDVFAVVLAASALALAGCGASAAPEAASTTTSSSPTATPTPVPSTITVSEKATCTQLIGPAEDGPLIKYVVGITTGNASDSVGMAKVAAARDDIKEIAKRADPEIKNLITALFSTDVNDFKAAGTDLLTRCK
ncbi:hypothetical protein [Arthrobacter bambusae]|uniref:hypothetical protein n=1 Tax=Arthrobacter bambusae TaxID=1338426 RepID=UPI0027898C2E|nr:hypothetical protein [Arthrobacter bambusae]MDQ0030149.1 ribosomal protein L11 [Arthrobacter bambusae]MDQ0097832.1 ribosomal protein L11 [Arthrobacter bambusae]